MQALAKTLEEQPSLGLQGSFLGKVTVADEASGKAFRLEPQGRAQGSW